MAGLLLAANSGSQAITANTAETVLQLTAAANQRIKIRGWSVTVAGTSPIDLTAIVMRQSSAGTSGTAVTPVKLESAAAETIQTAAATNFSSTEPTDAGQIEYKRLNGSFEKVYPLGQEPMVAGGGRIAIQCTSTTNATVAAEFQFEE